MKNKLLRYGLLVLVYGTLYMLIELLWKCGIDKLHWSMFILAALGGISVAKLNDNFTYEIDISLQCLIGGFIVTISEGVVGHIFNSNYVVWDYRSLPFSYWHSQINLIFSFVWAFILCPVAILIDDALDYYVFKSNERPYYKLCGRVLFYLPERRC